MHHTAPGGVSQSAPSSGRNGDVDADGQILDSLRRRLDEAVGPTVDVGREEHVERVLFVVATARARQPGVRIVDGEPRYSAAWLDGAR